MRSSEPSRRDRGCSIAAVGEHRIVILSGNGLEHAILALAAMHVGVPDRAQSAPAYPLLSRDHQQLRAIWAKMRRVWSSGRRPQFAGALDSREDQTRAHLTQMARSC